MAFGGIVRGNAPITKAAKTPLSVACELSNQ